MLGQELASLAGGDALPAPAPDGQSRLAFHSKLPANRVPYRCMWGSDSAVVPRCCKMSPASSQAAGGFQNSLPLAGKMFIEGSRSPDIHSWLIVQCEPGPLPRSWDIWAGWLQGRCARPYQAAHSGVLVTFSELLSDQLFSKVTILALSLWLCDPGTSISQFWHVWDMLPQ